MTDLSALPPFFPARAMLLLHGAEFLSRERDVRALFRTTAEFATRYLEGRFGLLFSVRFVQAEACCALIGCCVADGTETHWDEVTVPQGLLPMDQLLQDCMRTDQGYTLESLGQEWRLAFAIGEFGAARWVLEIHTPRKPSLRRCQALSLFLRCFENQHRQWEHTNLDTLTRLLNRKTFDDDFDRLILAAEAAEQANREAGDRRDSSHHFPAHPCWLGVVDIDHFKRINDNYGHLFGDEVLLRVADLMRQSFRSQDKLFRFGGEEFVIMLRNVPEDNVCDTFDRFRQAVEHYDFPQVGRVTCSVGYSRIDPQIGPAELLGRADEALYFSKDHGRNQVNGFDDLVMSGLLQLKAPPEVEVNAAEMNQADIDELFG
ncbi:MAG: GGDEF domain-containing protein [Rhodocyclales bacterium]|nr:GGDEF domain-containing protein [Rhodocyclales bacterium]